jgi:hypothetical protein
VLKFLPLSVTTVPNSAGPDVGNTLVTLGAVVVSTIEPPAGQAMALMATTNMMVPYWPATPATMQVTEVVDTHVGDVHVFSTPVAPYVIAGTDDVMPKPVPVRVTTVVMLPSNVDGDADVGIARGGRRSETISWKHMCRANVHIAVKHI